MQIIYLIPVVIAVAVVYGCFKAGLSVYSILPAVVTGLFAFMMVSSLVQAVPNPYSAYTFVIAASDTPSEQKYWANYKCDGTNDYAEVESAIAAASNGDSILLLPGNYYWPDHKVTENKDVTITGLPTSPAVIRPVGDWANRPFLVTSNGATFQYLTFDGGGATCTDYMIAAWRDNITISHVTFNDWRLANGEPMILMRGANIALSYITAVNCYVSGFNKSSELLSLGGSGSITNVTGVNSGAVMVWNSNGVALSNLNISVGSAVNSSHAALYIEGNSTNVTGTNFIFSRFADPDHGSMEIRYCSNVTITGVTATGFEYGAEVAGHLDENLLTSGPATDVTITNLTTTGCTNGVYAHRESGADVNPVVRLTLNHATLNGATIGINLQGPVGGNIVDTLIHQPTYVGCTANLTEVNTVGTVVN